METTLGDKESRARNAQERRQRGHLCPLGLLMHSGLTGGLRPDVADSTHGRAAVMPSGLSGVVHGR
jgi:hypothetical protein